MARKVLTEQEKIERWLKKLAKNYKDIGKSLYFNDAINICSPFTNGIHMYTGLEYIADLLGFELLKTPYTYEDSQTEELSFVYDGVRFFQLGHDNKDE